MLLLRQMLLCLVNQVSIYVYIHNRICLLIFSNYIHFYPIAIAGRAFSTVYSVHESINYHC